MGVGGHGSNFKEEAPAVHAKYFLGILPVPHIGTISYHEDLSFKASDGLVELEVSSV